MFSFFFFNDTATTEIYTLSLHDALPILTDSGLLQPDKFEPASYAQYQGDPKKAYWFFDEEMARAATAIDGDRKSTRLNSSHSQISYAVFCLKKKKKCTHTLTVGVNFDSL